MFYQDVSFFGRGLLKLGERGREKERERMCLGEEEKGEKRRLKA